MRLVPRDHAWPGLRRFAAIVAVLFALSTAGTLTVMATSAHDARAVDIAAVAWLFAGLPLVLGLLARLLAAPRPLAVAGVGLLAAVALLMTVMAAPSLLAAPRLLLGGATAGTVQAVAASHAAWAEVSPARVRTDLVGTGVYTTMKDGRRTSTSISAAPVVPDLAHTGETSLFLCDDRDDLLDPGTGTLAGALVPATDLAGDAVRRLAEQGVQVGPRPRCLDPTLGGWALTLALALLLAALYTLVLTGLAAWALVRAALGR